MGQAFYQDSSLVQCRTFYRKHCPCLERRSREQFSCVRTTQTSGLSLYSSHGHKEWFGLLLKNNYETVLFNETHFVLSKLYESLSLFAPKTCFLFLKWPWVVGNASNRRTCPALVLHSSFLFNTVPETLLHLPAGQNCFSQGLQAPCNFGS